MYRQQRARARARGGCQLGGQGGARMQVPRAAHLRAWRWLVRGYHDDDWLQMSPELAVGKERIFDVDRLSVVDGHTTALHNIVPDAFLDVVGDAVAAGVDAMQ